MNKFLSGATLKTKVRNLLGGAGPINLAVAYWGKGAAEILGFPQVTGDIRIICDLRSGACNPFELKEVLRRGAQIWTLDGLHSKVYLAPNVAIVGSANASANGLGEEGIEVVDELEAALWTDDQTDISNVKQWFSRRLEQSEKIESADIEKFKAEWLKRRSARPVRRDSSLLKMLDRDPGFFRDRRVFLLLCEASKESSMAKRKFKEISQLRYSRTDLDRYEGKGYRPFYEDRTGWPVSPGDCLIDFTISGDGGHQQKVQYNKTWQVRERNWEEPIGSNKIPRLILIDEITKVAGLKFPADEQRKLRHRIEKWLAAAHREEIGHGNLIFESLDQLPRLGLSVGNA